MNVTISKTLKKLPHEDYRKFINFQGKLKHLSSTAYDKLKQSMEEEGIITPFFIWKNTRTGKLSLMDGKQRTTILDTEKATPYMMPVVYIHAKSQKDAAERLLLISSKYGKITQEGWDGYSNDFGIDAEWTRGRTTFGGWTEVSSAKTPHKGQMAPVTNLPSEKLNALIANTIKQIIIYVPAEEFEDLFNDLQAIGEKEGIENNTDILLFLLDQTTTT